MARAGNRIEIPETAQEFINMEAMTIEIVNPKAKQLIKDLADLKLINIGLSSPKQQKNKEFLEYLISSPEMSDEDYNYIEQKRKHLRTWRKSV